MLSEQEVRRLLEAVTMDAALETAVRKAYAMGRRAILDELDVQKQAIEKMQYELDAKES